MPTHGDWQNRNWLADDAGVVKVIDFGRAALRPAGEDFERLAVREFLRVPGAEQAFLRGYGEDPREAEAWFRQRVRAAVAVAVWAFHVGDDSYEAEGHPHDREAPARPSVLARRRIHGDDHLLLGSLDALISNVPVFPGRAVLSRQAPMASPSTDHDSCKASCQ